MLLRFLQVAGSCNRPVGVNVFGCSRQHSLGGGSWGVSLDGMLPSTQRGGECYNVTMLLLLPLFFIWDEPFLLAVVTVVTSSQFVGSRLVFSLRVPLSDTLL